MTATLIQIATDISVAGTGGLYRLLFAPGSRTFWLYLLPSLLVAVWLERKRREQGVLPERARLLCRETWLGRSAISDYWIIVLNAILVGYFFSPFTAGVIESIADLARAPSAASSVVGAQSSIGTDPSGFGAQFFIAILVAAILFVVDDFSRFLLHWLEHRVSWLWEFHKVHHSAEQLNFLTAERHHPVSVCYYALGFSSIAMLANLALLNLPGFEIAPMTLLGGNLFWVLANMLLSTLRHSPVWVSFGPRVERYLISPAQHQVHHSDDPRHYDRNLGSTLAIWDRLFGTLYLTRATPEPLRFGLGAENALYRTPWDLYARPVTVTLARLFGRAGASRATLSGRPADNDLKRAE